MVDALRVLQSNGRPVRGLLKRKHVYEDKFLPKKEDADILLPVRAVSEDVMQAVRHLAPEARVVEDPDLRKNRRTRSFRRELQKILPKDVYADAARAYEQVGEVGIITVFDSMVPYEKEIAEGLMDTNKGIRLVLKKAGRHEGDDRLQAYEVLAGEGSSETVHRENGVDLHVDVQKAYYSSRTFEERRRVSQLVSSGERVLVAFSGIGPYVCVIAKNSDAAEVWGIESNQEAHEFAVRNVEENELSNVELVCGDVREAVEDIDVEFDRIVMPHPTEADYYLGDVLRVAADNCEVHLYLFSKPGGVDNAKRRFRKAAEKQGFVITDIQTHEQFHVSPRVSKYCFDLRLKRR